MVALAVAPAHAKDGGKSFDVAVLQCIGDGAEVIVDAVSVSTADPVIPLGAKCAAAVKSLQDAGFELDSAISRPVTFTYTFTKSAKSK
jgi:hypothetical protein